MTPAPVDLERETDRAETLRLYALGYKSARIAEEIGRSDEYVRTLIREAAKKLQADNAAHVEAAFLQQDLAIMELYERCVQTILASPVFPEKAILCAIKLFERRSRLLGLDRDKGPTNAGRGFQWLDKAGPAQLEKIAIEYGIPVPVPFA